MRARITSITFAPSAPSAPSTPFPLRLLIVTQSVDRNDPILGFFHRWIEVFAEHCTEVIVISQRVGSHQFPSNVTVRTLGKEMGMPVLFQMIYFKCLCLYYARSYDRVLVHMTPIWVVVGSGIWRLYCKPVYLWYEARGMKWSLQVALSIVKKVFSASSAGMPIKTPTSCIVGHGIDRQMFDTEHQSRTRGQLTTVGRITKAKHFDTIVEALAKLPDDYRLTIIGATRTHADQETLQQLKNTMRRLHQDHRVSIAELPHAEIVPLLKRTDIFVHASETPLDKAVLEAMLSGCLVVSCGEAFKGVLPEQCRATQENLHEKIQALRGLPYEEDQQLRKQLKDIVREQHSLEKLIPRLVEEMT